MSHQNNSYQQFHRNDGFRQVAESYPPANQPNRPGLYYNNPPPASYHQYSAGDALQATGPVDVPTKNSGNGGRQGPSLDLQARTLRVTGFSPKVTKELLQELFIQVGPVRNIVLRADHAFIEFQDAESVAYALAALEGVQLFGRILNMEPKINIPEAFVYVQQMRMFESRPDLFGVQTSRSFNQQRYNQQQRGNSRYPDNGPNYRRYNDHSSSHSRYPDHNHNRFNDHSSNNGRFGYQQANNSRFNDFGNNHSNSHANQYDYRYQQQQQPRHQPSSYQPHHRYHPY